MEDKGFLKHLGTKRKNEKKQKTEVKERKK